MRFPRSYSSTSGGTSWRPRSTPAGSGPSPSVRSRWTAAGARASERATPLRPEGSAIASRAMSRGDILDRYRAASARVDAGEAASNQSPLTERVLAARRGERALDAREARESRNERAASAREGLASRDLRVQDARTQQRVTAARNDYLQQLAGAGSPKGGAGAAGVGTLGAEVLPDAASGTTDGTSPGAGAGAGGDGGDYDTGYDDGYGDGYDDGFDDGRCGSVSFGFWGTWGYQPWCWWNAPFYGSAWWWHSWWSCGGAGYWPWWSCNRYWWGPFVSYSYAPPLTVVVEAQPEVVVVQEPVLVEVPVGEAIVQAPQAPNPEQQAELNRAANHYLAVGDEAFREGRYGDAARAYSRAVEFAPELGILRLVLSDALFAIGDYRWAAAEMRKALELDPSLALHAVDKRSFYGTPADFDRQLALLERYLEDHFLDADARLLLAGNYLFGGRPAAAVDLLESPFSSEVIGAEPGAVLLEASRRAQFGPEGAGSGR